MQGNIYDFCLNHLAGPFSSVLWCANASGGKRRLSVVFFVKRRQHYLAAGARESFVVGSLDCDAGV